MRHAVLAFSIYIIYKASLHWLGLKLNNFANN